MNGINQSAYVNSIASEYQNTRSYGAKDERVKKQPAASEKEKLNDVKGRTIGEPKLSDKALKYYEQLKKKYSNMEFVLVSPDKKAEVERNKGMYASNKELLVLIDSDKIERMAEDEEYRKKYEGILSNATSQVEMMKRQLGTNANQVSSIGMSFDDHGNASFFAVVDKSLATQRERIAAKREENREAKRAEAKKAEKEGEAEKLDKSHKVTVTAKSWDELLRKIDKVVMSDGADSMMTKEGDIINQYVIFTKVCNEQIALYGRTQKSILEAIRICKDRNVLREYLESREKEVVDIMMVLYDEEEIMRSYLESERHEIRLEERYEANIETAKRMLLKKKYSLEEIADCAELPLEVVKELEAELFQQI